LPAPTDPASDAAAEEKKAAAETAQLEIAEHNAKLAEKLESTAQAVASIAQTVSERPVVQQVTAAQPQAALPPLSEEQLMAMVDGKQITMAQAMAYQRKRAMEDAKSEAHRATAETLAHVGARAAEQQVTALIGEYKQAVPALGQRGSTEWQEAAKRFSRLVSIGYPATLQTELQALREIYGDEPSKREEPKERTKERATRGNETPSSASSRAAAPSRRGRASSEPDPDLAADHRTYVEHMISIGQYKGWDDDRAQKYVARAKQPRKARAG
jgi:hypothetical protein